MSLPLDLCQDHTTFLYKPFLTLLLPGSLGALVLPHILLAPLGVSLIFPHCTTFPFNVIQQMTPLFTEPYS